MLCDFFSMQNQETHGTILCVCFTEPFPAFKSWQEDCESGEAQLSPQAGRMNHHPLEEDCPPVLSHCSLDFGQSQRFLHDPETLTSSSKALSFARYVIFMYLWRVIPIMYPGTLKLRQWSSKLSPIYHEAHFCNLIFWIPKFWVHWGILFGICSLIEIFSQCVYSFNHLWLEYKSLEGSSKWSLSKFWIKLILNVKIFPMQLEHKESSEMPR